MGNYKEGKKPGETRGRQNKPRLIRPPDPLTDNPLRITTEKLDAPFQGILYAYGKGRDRRTLGLRDFFETSADLEHAKVLEWIPMKENVRAIAALVRHLFTQDNQTVRVFDLGGANGFLACLLADECNVISRIAHFTVIEPNQELVDEANMFVSPDVESVFGFAFDHELVQKRIDFIRKRLRFEKKFNVSGSIEEVQERFTGIMKHVLESRLNDEQVSLFIALIKMEVLVRLVEEWASKGAKPLSDLGDCDVMVCSFMPAFIDLTGEILKKKPKAIVRIRDMSTVATAILFPELGTYETPGYTCVYNSNVSTWLQLQGFPFHASMEILVRDDVSIEGLQDAIGRQVKTGQDYLWETEFKINLLRNMLEI